MKSYRVAAKFEGFIKNGEQIFFVCPCGCRITKRALGCFKHLPTEYTCPNCQKHLTFDYTATVEDTRPQPKEDPDGAKKRSWGYRSFKSNPVRAIDTDILRAGTQEPGRPWLLSALNTWEYNPFYRGPATPRPDQYC